TIVDGAEQRVVAMPYVIYADAVGNVVNALYDLGLIVTFPWREWDGVERYRHGRQAAEAPVTDVVRLLSAIVRADRFTEGTRAPSIETGVFGALLDRAQCWLDDPPPT